MSYLLADNVALKDDEIIIFDKPNVETYLKENPEKFKDIVWDKDSNYHFRYGYNQDNQPIKFGYEQGYIQRIILKTKDVPKKRFKLIISYDGSDYHGFQVQAKQKTIQGIVSDLISEVNNQEVLVQGASRTDSGVHALMQVMHFDSETDLNADRWKSFLRHRLPGDIYLQSIEEVHPLFHSRYDVYSKEYLYKINIGDPNPFLVKYQWQVKNIDLRLLEDQLNKLIGSHDFTSFCKAKSKDNIRKIYNTSFKVSGDTLEIVISGNGFLRYMVRIIINHLVLYATGRTDLDILDIIKEKSRRHTKDLAPAEGLYLNKIIY